MLQPSYVRTRTWARGGAGQGQWRGGGGAGHGQARGRPGADQGQAVQGQEARGRRQDRGRRDRGLRWPQEGVDPYMVPRDELEEIRRRSPGQHGCLR